ncbi:hypothetical protein ACFOOK_06440 [Micromonospora krabiensis]|uniref:Uncharacterized protein n=1 Tax=Micromonospora krabiensis TaxID=307121 RepID=A0A1C3NCP7_9ACTN|nr:hypothetical protein [Micromonospora krabiensis]SBV30363.1 hypothetical protein GA0070620_5960 [Micromonospora krabiensis]
MRRGVRMLGLSVFGGGIGIEVGWGLGTAATPWAVATCLVGLALVLLGAGAAAEPLADPQRPPAERPTFAHLGPRVEQILRTAEEQAEAVVEEARREAERIVAAARSEAATVGDTARSDVAAPAAEFGAAPDDRRRGDGVG